MSKSLPSRPNLEQLKKQAKDLLKDYKSGKPQALDRLAEFHPGWGGQKHIPAGGRKVTLSDAQLVVAREYGFETWPKLKEALRALNQEDSDPHTLFKEALEKDDAKAFAQLLNRFPEMKARINDPVCAFDAPVITCVRSPAMLDVLLTAGADINARSRWWAGGFGLLHGADPELAAYAIQRGATIDVHAAARLGRLDELQRMIRAKPDLVNARGGDGQMPLHFASSLQIAEYLIDHGATIDAEDIDHESTPAQYMVKDRQAVARYLVQRGCRTDLLMAAALGDLELARKHLDNDPEAIQMTVSERYFPKRNPRSGGTIYIWTFGHNKGPHAIARDFGHKKLLELLMDRSPDRLKLAVAGEAGDEALLKDILAKHPELIRSLSDEDRRKLPNAAQENQHDAVRLMLNCGWPVDARGQHGATALHWAAFNGNVELARLILGFKPSLELIDVDFKGTALGWAIYGSVNGWHCRTGNYPATVEVLILAGAKVPPQFTGTEEVQAVIDRFKGSHSASVSTR